MNAEQKQRAAELLAAWRATAYALHAARMADLLQDLVDAPEEFESLTRNEDGTVSLKPGFKAVAYTAQEALPATNPAQISSLAEPFGYFKAEPFGWTDCAETDDGAIALYTAPPAPSVPEAEPVARVTGYYAGYLSIVTVDGRVLPSGTALYTAQPAPSVPDGWRPFLTDVITAAGLLEHGKRDKGLAGRIGKFAFDAMRAAPTPAEPPADVARDAERYRWLRKRICFSGNGDGTASMHAINLPNSARFPEVGQLEAGADAAIDAAIERDKKGMEA